MPFSFSILRGALHFIYSVAGLTKGENLTVLDFLWLSSSEY